MSGAKVLLDTNFILSMRKNAPEVLADIAARNLVADECAYSAVTRMELLGFRLACPTATAKAAAQQNLPSCKR